MVMLQFQARGMEVRIDHGYRDEQRVPIARFPAGAQ
jgi:hypothetical protein